MQIYFENIEAMNVKHSKQKCQKNTRENRDERMLSLKTGQHINQVRFDFFFLIPILSMF